MKKKLNLEDLKVKSFVTDLDNNFTRTLKGGLEVDLDLTIDINQISLPPTHGRHCETRQPKTEGYTCHKKTINP